MEIIYYISLAIGGIGIIAVIWGSLVATFEICSLEIERFKGKNICRRREYLRHHFGFYLILGLEFLIAADIIQTFLQPTLQELAILGSLVAIRTVLSFFLNKEMEERHRCQEE